MWLNCLDVKIFEKEHVAVTIFDVASVFQYIVL